MTTKFANSDSAKELGRKVSMARAVLGMTQKQLSEECKVSQTTITLIENGKTRPHVASLIRIANAVDIPATELLDIIDNFDKVHKEDL